ncbi:MAG: two-component regulator propeller domain-containing protein [Bacteroidia bacterium]
MHTSLEVASGLPSPTVYDISQDVNGFMWIANGKGLCRFDGLRYLQLEGKLLQGKSLSNINWVKGKLVCQDFSGNFYSIKNNELVKIDGIKNYGSYVSSFTWKNGLIFTNNNSLKYFDLNQKKKEVLHQGTSIRSAFTIDKDGFYFLSKDCIWKLSQNSKSSIL